MNDSELIRRSLNILTEAANLVTADQVPAIINKSAGISANIVQLKRLPQFMQDAVRQLGALIFSKLTTTHVGNITVIADFGGNGPNTSKEVRSVMGYLANHATPSDDVDFNLSQIIPGYTAEGHLYKANGVRFLVVRDPAGEYVYAWPDHESMRTSKDRMN